MKSFAVITVTVFALLIFPTTLLPDESEFVIHLEPDPEFDTTKFEGWDGGETDPGAVVFHDGQFHMFYNGMDRAFSEYSTGYAVSSDGHRWKRLSESPVLTLADTGHEGKNLASNSALVLDDGTWVLYLTVTPSTRKYMGHIIRATADDPMGPWTVHPDPVLMPGGEDEWDGDSVGHASVNHDGSGFVMHYIGLGDEVVEGFNEEHARVGVAYSDDGITWTKYNDPGTDSAFLSSSDPVFEVDTTPGTWEKWHIHDANVEYDGNEWRMAYRSFASMDRGDIGFATSKDGIHWNRYPANPIVTNRMVKESGVWFTNYVRHDGTDYIWFEAGWIDSTRTYLITRDE